MDGFNDISIDRVASSILSLLGVERDSNMAPPIEDIAAIGSCDRVFMYNPDAIAEWIYEAYRENFASILKDATLNLEMLSMVPPKTPVCFASMYSGLLPDKHGIQRATLSLYCSVLQCLMCLLQMERNAQ